MPITPARSFNTCTCYTIMQLPNTIYMYIIHTVITFTLSEYKLYTVCISFLIYYLLYEFIFFFKCSEYNTNSVVYVLKNYMSNYNYYMPKFLPFLANLSRAMDPQVQRGI